MPMIWGTILTMGIQVATAIINISNNKKNAEAIKKLQHEYKLSKQAHTQQRDKEKFLRSCQLQLEMEEQDHKYKIECARSKFLESIKTLAQKQGLDKYYPLTVSPQILSNPILPTSDDEIDNSREYILCVLTNSNNTLFNKILGVELDQYLSQSFSKFWNQSSQHQVCYYTNVWKPDKLLSYDNSDWNNLRSLITAPTIFLSPVVASDKSVSIRITLMVNGKEFHSEKKLGIDFDVDPNCEDYGKQVKCFKSKFEDVAFTEILCDAAYLVDVHYWTNYKLPPRLPQLIASKVIPLKEEKVNEYNLAYESFYRNVVLGNVDESAQLSSQEIKDIKLMASIDQFNFPLRCIGYLESLLKTAMSENKSESLIYNTLISICNSRSLGHCEDVEQLEVSLLDSDDMEVITKLANISNSLQLNTNLFRNIIREYICK